MLENLFNSLRTMRKRGVILTVVGAALSVVSYYSRGLELIEFPMELFSMIAIVFFIYGLFIAVHNTNAIAPAIFSFRYTKNKLFPKKDREDEYGAPMGFHYELYSDYLADRRKWKGMGAAFFLAAVYFLLSIAMFPLVI